MAQFTIEDLERLESYVKSGKVRKAQTVLSGINVNKIDRNAKADLANICRRLGNTTLALRILRPQVFPENRFSEAATKKELFSYAMTLSLIGVKKHSKEIFNRIDFEQFAEGQLRYAFHLMTMWNYGSAEKLLKLYLVQDGVSHYHRLIARVNLVPCLLNKGRFFEAIERCEELIRDLHPEDHSLLLGNVYELLGQCYFNLNQHALAQKYLEIAESKLRRHSSRYLFYVLKWKTLNEFKMNQSSAKAVQSLSRLQKLAYNKHDWETVRDCDFHWATTQDDVSRLSKVYFGTQFNSYRKRIQNVDMFQEITTTAYIWGGEEIVFDERLGVDSRGNQFSAGRNNHRLLYLLSSDFYRPFHLGEVFEYLYEGERFHPIHSINKVHQSIFRLRQILKESFNYLSLESSIQGYRLDIKPGYGVRVYKRKIDINPLSVECERLRKIVAGKSFAKKQVINLLGISAAQASRVLNKAVSKKQIDRYGTGPGTFYKFSSYKSGSKQAAS